MTWIEIFPFIVLFLIWIAIRFMREHYILGRRAINKRATQNLCSKYNPHVVRGKDGRFKSVQSPHLNKR
jgi:flagellar biogenesis protein FliO